MDYSRVAPDILVAGYPAFFIFVIRPDIRFHLPDIRPDIRLEKLFKFKTVFTNNII